MIAILDYLLVIIPKGCTQHKGAREKRGDQSSDCKSDLRATYGDAYRPLTRSCMGCSDQHTERIGQYAQHQEGPKPV